MQKKGLGRGLESLLSIYDEENEKENRIINKDENVNKGVLEIDIEKVIPNPNQPRKIFDETALKELSDSIKIHGVIQPIVLNTYIDGKYLIIAGERRYRASKLAGLKTIPAIIKNYTEKQIKEISIIENLQREDLNPIEVAKAIKLLMDEYNFTQETVAERIGKSRPVITNTLRLLNLQPEVIKLIEEGKLSAGHARCLVVINKPEEQYAFAKTAINNRISVRELEKKVKNYLNPNRKNKNKQIDQSIELKEFINQMQQIFSTKVSLIGSENKGRIYIDYYNKDDLDRIYHLVQILKSKTITLGDLDNFKKIK